MDTDDQLDAAFGALLRQARLANGLSLAGLAALVHYSKGYLGNLESGAKAPSVEVAERCDEALSTGDRRLARAATARPIRARGRQAPVAPAQLPGRPHPFTGRGDLLARLDTILDSAPAGGSLAIVSGMAGVGKTALCLQWAHRAAARFPDGTLFADLRGFGPSPGHADPLHVINGFIRALGAEATPIADEAVALYRSLLYRRRVLIVLDNVASATQVRPLIPGSSDCFVLVNSRSRLRGLVTREGGQAIAVDPLSPTESVTLLATLAGRSYDDREALVLPRLSELCGGLPLALRIAAERLARATAPSGTIGLRDLMAGPRRLDTLRIAGDQSTDLRTVLGWSYKSLVPETRYLFAALGRCAGPSVTVEAAAAMLATDVDTARRSLEELAAVHLLDEWQPGRYRFHELVADYAADLGRTVDDAVVDRLIDWYLDLLRAAAAGLAPVTARPPAATMRPTGLAFESARAASEFVKNEQANISALIERTVTGKRPEAGWMLAEAMRGLQNHGHCITLRVDTLVCTGTHVLGLLMSGHDADRTGSGRSGAHTAVRRPSSRPSSRAWSGRSVPH